MTEGRKTKKKWVITSDPLNPGVLWKQITILANKNTGLKEATTYARKLEIYHIESDSLNIMLE